MGHGMGGARAAGGQFVDTTRSESEDSPARHVVRAGAIWAEPSDIRLERARRGRQTVGAVGRYGDSSHTRKPVSSLSSLSGDNSDAHGASSNREPVIICISDSQEDRLRLIRLLDGFGVLVMAPDARAARRALQSAVPESADEDHVLRRDQLLIDEDRQQATWAGHPLELTHLERQLLRSLAQEPGRAWTFDQLYAAVWHTSYDGDRSSVHSAIKRLRRKLREAATSIHIDAVRGIGFRLAVRPPIPHPRSAEGTEEQRATESVTAERVVPAE